MSDPLSPIPPPRFSGPDSFTRGLVTIAGSRKGRSLSEKVWPLLLAVVTGVGTWFASKADSKAELQAAIALTAEVRKLREDAQVQHAKVLADIEQLRADVLSDSLRQPGKVTRLERSQYAVWRSMAELRAATLTAESPKARAAKVLQAERFGRAFDTRTRDGQDPVVAHELVFAQVAVP